jgi:hypothetical protein
MIYLSCYDCPIPSTTPSHSYAFFTVAVGRLILLLHQSSRSALSTLDCPTSTTLHSCSSIALYPVLLGRYFLASAVLLRHLLSYHSHSVPALPHRLLRLSLNQEHSRFQFKEENNTQHLRHRHLPCHSYPDQTTPDSLPTAP